MAKKTKSKKAPKKSAPKAKTAKAPKLSVRQLTTLKGVQAADGLAPTAFDRRTLNSLKGRGLVSVSTKAVTLTKAGTAFLGAPSSSEAAMPAPGPPRPKPIALTEIEIRALLEALGDDAVLWKQHPRQRR
jgi:hypothetical protein